jgi:maltose O-acetyltransferase
MGILASLKYFCFVTLRIKKYQFLSTCKNVNGKPSIYNPLLLNENGKISFGQNVQLGVINSAGFYNNYSYFESRNLESLIEIGDNLAINNAFSFVAFSKILVFGNSSVVTKDTPDNVVAAGNPAKVIRNL